MRWQVRQMGFLFLRLQQLTNVINPAMMQNRFNRCWSDQIVFRSGQFGLRVVSVLEESQLGRIKAVGTGSHIFCQSDAN